MSSDPKLIDLASKLQETSVNEVTELAHKLQHATLQEIEDTDEAIKKATIQELFAIQKYRATHGKNDLPTNNFIAECMLTRVNQLVREAEGLLQTFHFENITARYNNGVTLLTQAVEALEACNKQGWVYNQQRIAQIYALLANALNEKLNKPIQALRALLRSATAYKSVIGSEEICYGYFQNCFDRAHQLRMSISREGMFYLCFLSRLGMGEMAEAINEDDDDVLFQYYKASRIALYEPTLLSLSDMMPAFVSLARIYMERSCFQSGYVTLEDAFTIIKRKKSESTPKSVSHVFVMEDSNSKNESIDYWNSILVNMYFPCKFASLVELPLVHSLVPKDIENLSEVDKLFEKVKKFKSFNEKGLYSQVYQAYKNKDCSALIKAVGFEIQPQCTRNAYTTILETLKVRCGENKKDTMEDVN